MALGVDDLERLANVHLGNPLQGQVVELAKDAVQIEPGKCLGPHLACACR